MAKDKKVAKPVVESSDESEEEVVQTKKGKTAAPAAKPSKKAAKEESESESEEEEEEKPKSKKDDSDSEEEEKEEKEASEEEEEEEKPKSNKRKTTEATESTEGGEEEESKTIFVANIAFSADEDKVREFFSEVGTVVSYTPVKNGSAKIEFESGSEANAAVALTGTELEGRALFIKLNGAPSAPRTDNARPAPGGNREGKHSVFIGRLGYDTTEEALRETFAECGEINQIRLLMDRDTGDFKGAAFIDFAERSGAESAVGYNDSEFGGRTIRVDHADNKPSGGGRGGFRGGDRGGFRGGRGGGRGGFRGGRGGDRY